MPKHLSQERIQALCDRMYQVYSEQGGINNVDGLNLPSYSEVAAIVKNILQLLFPGFYASKNLHQGNLKYWCGQLLDDCYQRLLSQITKSLQFLDRELHPHHCQQKADVYILDILDQLPVIREILHTDILAAYNGDPASKSYEEIILSYPGILAVAIHRIAHEFYLRKIPLIDRLISEYAHMKTGIDIHPGAKIGRSFFIDHGTGVVIGETTKIGNNVKIYHLVTLGALSFKKKEDGTLAKGLQRHPTIEDNVVLYAGCTILGDITIGKNVTIGGNVWVTKSVPPGVTITFDVEKTEYKVIGVS